MSPIIAISVSFIAEVNPVTRIIELQDRLTVELETPVRALAPGQAGVLYKGNQVLGGGMINRTM